MSNRNNKNDEMTIIMMVMGALAMAAIFAAVFICALLTFFCILAWDEERRFFGSTITPYEARSFIRAGLIGGAACTVGGIWFWLSGDMEVEGLWYCAAIGYMVGSLGWAIHHAMNVDADEQEQAAQTVLPPSLPRPMPPQPRSAEERPFHFASWDDEEPRQ